MLGFPPLVILAKSEASKALENFGNHYPMGARHKAAQYFSFFYAIMSNLSFTRKEMSHCPFNAVSRHSGLKGCSIITMTT